MADFSIVVAEDDEDDYFILQEAFKPLPACELTHVKDGKLLIEYLNSQSKAHLEFPSLIILDVNMPKIDGIEALTQIKLSPALSAIPVIMHSTSGDNALRARCLTLGAEGFCSKGNYQKEVTAFAKSVLFFLHARQRQPLSRFVDKQQ